jgi:hypothetical protein
VRVSAVLAIALHLFLAPFGLAQSPAPGVITGRIFNPASGEYIRNAQIRIESTGELITSEDGGYYRVSRVAPGPVTLIASFTGYQSVTATVQVTAGPSPGILSSSARCKVRPPRTPRALRSSSPRSPFPARARATRKPSWSSAIP